MLFDTAGVVPTICVPEEKLSQAWATINYVMALNEQGDLSQLTAAVMGGILQYLVEGTPSHQGQTYLCRLYDSIHHMAPLFGWPLYYTRIVLSPETLSNLQWWIQFFYVTPGNTSHVCHMA
jgi:hypothetical protein